MSQLLRLYQRATRAVAIVSRNLRSLA